MKIVVDAFGGDYAPYEIVAVPNTSIADVNIINNFLVNFFISSTPFHFTINLEFMQY